MQVSTETGNEPVWAPTGRTLYYLQSKPCPHATCTMTRVMVVDLSSAGMLDNPKPQMLFETRERLRSIEIEPGGERLLVSVLPEERLPFHVILDARPLRP